MPAGERALVAVSIERSELVESMDMWP
jgi:hypothetical protein